MIRDIILLTFLMSFFESLITLRNRFPIITTKDGEVKSLSIRNAKTTGGCSENTTDAKARDAIRAKILELENALFDESEKYREILDIEQCYQFINSKIEREALHKGEQKEVLRKRKRSSVSSEDNQECNPSKKYVEKFDMVMENEEKLNDFLNEESSSAYNRMEDILDRLAKETNPEESTSDNLGLFNLSTNKCTPLSSYERLSSITIRASRGILEFPLGSIDFSNRFYSITLQDVIKDPICGNGSYGIIFKKSNVCYKIIVACDHVSQDKPKVRVVVNWTSPPESAITKEFSLRRSTFGDAYGEYMNNKRIQRFELLRRFVVLMEGMSYT